jgi:hypothetical protein
MSNDQTDVARCWVCSAPVVVRRVDSSQPQGVRVVRYLTVCSTDHTHVHSTLIYRDSDGGPLDLNPALTLPWRP